MIGQRGATFVALSILSVAAGSAQAQPLFGRARSIEAAAINADLVVVGRVLAVEAGRGDDGRRSDSIAVEVEEVLKQPPDTISPYRKLRTGVDRPEEVLAGWKARSARVLLACDLEGTFATAAIELVPEKPEALTSDLELIRDPEAVVRAAREAIRRTPATVRRLHTFGLVVPGGVVAGTQWAYLYGTGGHLILDVPADGHLERWARDALGSGTLGRREEGLRAIRFFRSGENVARVRALLDDPGWYRPGGDGAEEGLEVRIYGARRAAFETLKAWGEDAAMPVTREEVRPSGRPALDGPPG